LNPNGKFLKVKSQVDADSSIKPSAWRSNIQGTIPEHLQIKDFYLLAVWEEVRARRYRDSTIHWTLWQ